MLKMINVLDASLVQNFTHSFSNHVEDLDEQMRQGILSSSDIELKKVIANFMDQNNPTDLADALDINQQCLEEIQTGLALKKQNIAETAKIVALCLALETDGLNQLNIADSIADTYL
ncbi:hypothetical protein ACK1JC_08420 [Acinetobacter sp. TY2]|uniref:hypothetical protein n=1 Tax=unclassified Acinetobacter TaxID=196816 RepID=UPI003020ABE6